MHKFDSTHTDLEVAETFTEPLPYFLNRQLINALDDLEVPHEHLLRRQKVEEQRTRRATRSLRSARNLAMNVGAFVVSNK